ncbi:hypothetical protein BDB01DRAFT_839301 [Pilobolus umbonatus]|nr:hypothetical protein BDB01DRAFT_839301 [Pilobolus umbonatus]
MGLWRDTSPKMGPLPLIDGLIYARTHLRCSNSSIQLRDHGVVSPKDKKMDKICWDALDMTKIGSSSLAVAALVDLDTAVVWGFDPGLRAISVAADNNTRHRIRKTSTPEYFHLAGYHAANLPYQYQ